MAGKYQAPRGYHPTNIPRYKRKEKASGSLIALCVPLAALNVVAGVLLWLRLSA